MTLAAPEQPQGPAIPAFSSSFLAQYEYVRALGQGGMGSVHLMRQVQLERIVAVKVVKGDEVTGDQVRRLLKEAKTLAGLNHPNIVSVHDAGTDGSIPYIVCEYVEGMSLAERLRRSPPLALEESLVLAIQILDALRVAHEKGVVHRDLKPDNIFLTRDAVPKIGDFGLAKVQNLPSGTSVGVVMGTPRYMSPEQCRGEGSTASSDLYALGVMLFEMATGQAPYPGPSLAELLYQHVGAPIPALRSLRPELPQALEDAVSRALAKSPDARFRSAEEFRTTLSEIWRSVATRAPTLPAGVTPRAPSLPAGVETIAPPAEARPAASIPGARTGTTDPGSGAAMADSSSLQTPSRPRPWPVEAYCFAVVVLTTIALVVEGVADLRLHGYLSPMFQYRTGVTLVMLGALYWFWSGRFRRLLIVIQWLGIIFGLVALAKGVSILETLFQLFLYAVGLGVLVHRATAAYFDPEAGSSLDLTPWADRRRAVKAAWIVVLSFLVIRITTDIFRERLAEPVQDDDRTVSLCPVMRWSRIATEKGCLMDFVDRGDGIVQYDLHVKALGPAPVDVTDQVLAGVRQEILRREPGFVLASDTVATYGGQRWFEGFGRKPDDRVDTGQFVFVTACQGTWFELSFTGYLSFLEINQDLLRSVVATFRVIRAPAKRGK